MKPNASSLSWYERAVIIPGRSLTRSKAPGKMFAVGDGPMFASGGEGAYLFDIGGNRYVDMLCGLGAISLGYGRSYPTQPEPSGVFSLPHRLEVETAEKALRVVAPWASRIRFTMTGSEATHAAYRIAKCATGRDLVLRGDWAYHGWHEWTAGTCGPSGSGVASFPLNFDFEIALHKERLAAIFIEPHRWEPVNPAWLRYARDFCDRYGIVLVFDSMIYGGRWAKGGTSEYFGVQPDLECFGKAYGNGENIAFVVGNDLLDKHGEIVSGTYSGNATALSRCLDALSVYEREPVIETLWARGKQLRRGLRDVLPADVQIEGQPVHQRLVWASEDEELRFGAAMAKRGVLWHRACVNVSYAHTPEIIERVIEAAEGAAKEIRA